jgi:hypothetical protein
MPLIRGPPDGDVNGLQTRYKWRWVDDFHRIALMVAVLAVPAAPMLSGSEARQLRWLQQLCSGLQQLL